MNGAVQGPYYRRGVAALSLLLLAGGIAQSAVSQVEHISVSLSGQGGNGDSGGVNTNSFLAAPSAISGDGRFVAFASAASDLVTGDTNGRLDVFVRDRQTGTTERVSVSSTGVQANHDCVAPAISDDGQRVAFMSRTDNWGLPDDNADMDVFVRDRQTQETRIVTMHKNGDGSIGGFTEGHCDISGDGVFVTFGWQGEDQGAASGVYRHNLQTGVYEPVSVNGMGQTRPALHPAISETGRFIVFESRDETLVENDTNTFNDVFLRDMELGETRRISVTSAGGQGSGVSGFAEISADGRFAVFSSDSPELIPSKTPARHVYLFDRADSSTERISGLGEGPRGLFSDLSDDGRFLVWRALGTGGGSDLLVRDRTLGVTERITPSAESDPRFSGTGQTIAFVHPSDLLPSGTEFLDVFTLRYDPGPANRPPAADAPSDRTIKTKATKAKVRLDGSGSSDPDKDKLTFRWLEGKTQIATGVKPTVKLKKGVHTITLEVRDPGGLTDTDEVVITVKKKRR